MIKPFCYYTYAHKLIEAGVPVTGLRYHGTIHDFVMLSPITNTPAVRGAIEQASHMLKKYCQIVSKSEIELIFPAVTASNNPVFYILHRFRVELALVVTQILYRILYIYKRQCLSSVLLCQYHFI